MKNVYLIVSDLHISYNNKPHRKNYFSEIHSVLVHIIGIVDKYKNECCNVNILFLGDIFDRSFNDSFMFSYYQSFFIELSYICNLYVNFGNHEFSFYKDNPFWALVQDIPSTMVSTKLTSTYEPRGYSNYLKVVDIIEDGEVKFLFNHFSCNEQNAMNYDGIKIGLFHEHFASANMVKSMEILGSNFNGYHVQDIEICNFLRGYNYCFTGHNHSIYGKVNYSSATDNMKKFILYHLASLGRPKENEVNDNLLERNIPVVIVQDGILVGVEDNTLMLPSREECLKLDNLNNSKIKKNLNKELKEIRSIISDGVNPCENVRQILLANGREFIEFFNDVITKDLTNEELEVNSICNNHSNWRF